MSEGRAETSTEAKPTGAVSLGSPEMKVRIGYGLGTRTTLHDGRFGAVVDELERLSFDSLWVSERIGAEAPDPMVAMAYAAGRTENLKFGMSVMVLPGRNPVVLAKAVASLATLSGGRLLPAFGLGLVHPLEQQAFGVERTERARWFNESMAVMRKCWSGQPVVHDGERYQYDGVQVKPVPKRMDVWLGGFAPSELKRVGRLADGWLPSFVTPADAEAGRKVIEQVCAEHDREIEQDHYGVLIPYSLGGVPDATMAVLAQRRPDIDPAEIVPTSWDELIALIKRFVDIGTTKFVILPIDEPDAVDDWKSHLSEAAEAVLPLETR
jgi:probable F420-dependent oxidoreductase